MYDYSEKNWIAFVTTPIKLRNVYDRINGLRTTKDCESWNSLLKKHIGRTTPLLWVVIRGLRIQEKKQ